MKTFISATIVSSVLWACAKLPDHTNKCISEDSQQNLIDLHDLSVAQEEGGFIAYINWCKGKSGYFLVHFDSGEQDAIVLRSVLLRARLAKLSGARSSVYIDGKFLVTPTKQDGDNILALKKLDGVRYAVE